MTTNQTFEDTSRSSWAAKSHAGFLTQKECIDAVVAGSLQRIAAALEQIEQHLYGMTPEGREHKERVKQETAESDRNVAKYRQLASAIKNLPKIPGIGLYLMTNWFYGVCPNDNVADPESWLKVCDSQRQLAGMGHVRREKLRRWAMSLPKPTEATP